MCVCVASWVCSARMLWWTFCLINFIITPSEMAYILTSNSLARLFRGREVFKVPLRHVFGRPGTTWDRFPLFERCLPEFEMAVLLGVVFVPDFGLLRLFIFSE